MVSKHLIGQINVENKIIWLKIVLSALNVGRRDTEQEIVLNKEIHSNNFLKHAEIVVLIE